MARPVVAAGIHPIPDAKSGRQNSKHLVLVAVSGAAAAHMHWVSPGGSGLLHGLGSWNSARQRRNVLNQTPVSGWGGRGQTDVTAQRTPRYNPSDVQSVSTISAYPSRDGHEAVNIVGSLVQAGFTLSQPRRHQGLDDGRVVQVGATVCAAVACREPR